MSGKLLSLPKRKASVWQKASHNLVLHLPSGTYYARKFKAGKGSFFKTTSQRTKGRAQTVADEMIAEWIGGKYATRRLRVEDICELLDGELEDQALQKDEHGRPLRAASTRVNDKNLLNQIKEHFGETFVDEIDEQYWDRWLRAHGRKLGRKPTEIAKYLSKVLTYAYLNKYINRKPRIKSPAQPKKSIPTFDAKKIRAFFLAANPTLQDLIVIGAECGLRPHENREMRWEWIRFTRAGAILSIPDWFEKRGRGREIHLTPNATQVLKRRRRTADSPFVFPSPSDPQKPINRQRLSRYWNRMLRTAEITEHALFHWLRHSFFSAALLDAKKELPKVAAYGGNSPKVLFDRYMAKDASRTKDMTSVLKLNLKDEEE